MASTHPPSIERVPPASPWDDEQPAATDPPVPQAAGTPRPSIAGAWTSIGVGIMVAGGAYPLVLAASWIFIGAVYTVWNLATRIGVSYGLTEMLLVVFSATIMIAAYSVFAAVYAAAAAVVTLPVFYLFVRSLKLRVRYVWLGAIAGGLVGFLATFPMLIFAAFFAGGGGGLWDSDLGWIAAVLAMGPALTTVLGQIGGAWGGRRADRQALGGGDWAEVLTPAGGWRLTSVSGVSDDLAERAPLFQFRIHHLLWISVWASLLLTAIRLSGAPFEFILPLLLGWLAFQSLTLCAGGWLARRLKLS